MAIGLGRNDLLKGNDHEELYNALSRHRSSYTIDDRLQTVMTYVTEGNLKAVERSTGISYNTLKEWKESEWWPIALQYCHNQKDKELETRFSKIIHDSVSGISDRIKNGDWQINKDGAKERVPLKARDLAMIANMLFDKRLMIRGESPVLANKISQEERFKRLENSFKEFSAQLKAKTIEGEVIND